MKIVVNTSLLQLFFLLVLLVFSRNTSSQIINNSTLNASVIQLQKNNSNYQAQFKGEMKSIKVENGKNASIYWVPSEIKSVKYLFVFHEWWGLNDFVKNEVDNWSEKLIDVNVVALDLYDGKIAVNKEDAADYMEDASSERITTIIRAAKDWAGDSILAATLGWSYGGGWSMRCALEMEKSAVGCVIYYGIPERDTAKLTSLNCSILGLFAKKDIWVNKQVISQYEDSMKLTNKKYLTFWFDGDHNFVNPSSKFYDEKIAAEANQKVFEYLNAVFIGEIW